MVRFHEDYLSKKRKASSVEQKPVNHYFSKKVCKDLLPALKSDQIKGEVLLIKWIAESLRPFLIVEDKGFLDFVDFLCSLNRQFNVPSQKKVRNQLMVFGELVELKMKEIIKSDINYFSATTHIWSSRTMDSFMAITLHGLTDNFSMINLTLEVKPLQGKHTGTFIMEQMSESFQKWGILKENMTMMLRDNASNVIKACCDWEIPHFSCIGHNLHLIVGPLFVQKRGRGTSINDDNDNCNEQLDDIVDYDEEELIEAINKLNN